MFLSYFYIIYFAYLSFILQYSFIVCFNSFYSTCGKIIFLKPFIYQYPIIYFERQLFLADYYYIIIGIFLLDEFDLLERNFLYFIYKEYLCSFFSMYSQDYLKIKTGFFYSLQDLQFFFIFTLILFNQDWFSLKCIQIRLMFHKVFQPRVIITNDNGIIRFEHFLSNGVVTFILKDLIYLDLIYDVIFFCYEYNESDEQIDKQDQEDDGPSYDEHKLHQYKDKIYKHYQNSAQNNQANQWNKIIIPLMKSSCLLFFLIFKCKLIKIKIMEHYQYIKIIPFRRMGVFAFLKKIIKSNDLFYSAEIFRFQESTKYKTVTGGFISLAIIVAIIVMFFNMILTTIQQKSIQSTLTVIKNVHPTLSTLTTNPETSDFMFAIRINEENYTKIKEYFDVQFLSHEMQKGILTNTNSLILEPCTEDHWRNQAKQLSYFENMHLGQWLCPARNLTLNLSGKKFSQFFSSQQIRVSACKNVTNSSKTCKTTNQIETYFKQNNEQLTFRIYYSNYLMNPGTMDYKSIYIEDKVNLVFGSKLGIKSYLPFKDYNMQTDTSIFPMQYYVKENGVITQQLPSMQPFTTSANSTFINFHFVKSADSLSYKRQVLKISFVLSFIGGGIGILVFLMFIIRMYTSFSFNKAIANKIFNKQIHDKDNQQDNDSQTNCYDYCKFISYSFCSWIGKKLSWKDSEYTKKCQQEVAKQLDIKTLLLRIAFLEYCITYKLQEYQLQSLRQARPRTLQEIKALRQKCSSIEQKQCTLPQKLKKQVKFKQMCNKKQNNQSQEISQTNANHQTKDSFLQNQLPLSKKGQEIKVEQMSQLNIQQTNKPMKHLYLFELRQKQLLEKLKNGENKQNIASTKSIKKIKSTKSIKVANKSFVNDQL